MCVTVCVKQCSRQAGRAREERYFGRTGHGVRGWSREFDSQSKVSEIFHSDAKWSNNVYVVFNATGIIKETRKQVLELNFH